MSDPNSNDRDYVPPHSQVLGRHWWLPILLMVSCSIIVTVAVLVGKHTKIADVKKDKRQISCTTWIEKEKTWVRCGSKLYEEKLDDGQHKAR